MAVTYRELTAAQQHELAKQKVFEFEYNHFIATIEAAAAPTDTAKQQAVALLEKQVLAAQAEQDAVKVLSVDAEVVTP